MNKKMKPTQLMIMTKYPYQSFKQQIILDIMVTIHLCYIHEHPLFKNIYHIVYGIEHIPRMQNMWSVK